MIQQGIQQSALYIYNGIHHGLQESTQSISNGFVTLFSDAAVLVQQTALYLETPEITCENFPPACIKNISDFGDLILPLIYIVAAFLLLGYFLWGAFKYILSRGEPDRLAEAKKTITYSIIGIVIVLLAYIATRIIAYVLNVEFFL